MPNTEVKLTNAESTWPEAAREDRKLLIKEKTLTNVGVFFICRSFLFACINLKGVGQRCPKESGEEQFADKGKASQ